MRSLIFSFLILIGANAMAIEFRLERIDLFVSKTSEMRRFYETVFEMKMKEGANGPYKFYSGDIPGFVTLQFVPEELSGIKFQQNRHQLNFRVSNLNEVVRKALSNGGIQQGEILEEGKNRIFSVTDPDNNYIIFTGE